MQDKNIQQAENPNEYKVDKIVFIVTPFFNRNADISIYDILLTLMTRDVKNPVK